MTQTMAYHPPHRATWARRAPAELGLRADALREAEEHALANEVRWPRDTRRAIGRGDPAPYNVPLGPVKERGGPSGLVVRHGYIAHEWGTPGRSDMTFSATKSYLSTIVGLAWQRGLIRDLDEPVARTVAHESLEDERNARITWHHLLQQTSEWGGTLFGIPDTVDHHRTANDPSRPKGTPRELQEPGTYWEYNDVRVNFLGLAALHAWRESLPAVLRHEVMDPIGASDAWHWHGYRNAWVEVDGRMLCSVPGGAHWGGGLFISTFDHARFGLLWQRGGEWEGRRIMTEEWIERATTPCGLNPQYGYMWWLNRGKRLWPDAPESAFGAIGAGGNVVYVDRAHDLVVVTRWVEDVAGVIARVVGAVV